MKLLDSFNPLLMSSLFFSSTLKSRINPGRDWKEQERTLYHMKYLNRFLSLVLVLVLSISFAAPAFAQQSTAVQEITDISTLFTGLYDEINPSVVYIAVQIPTGEASQYHQMQDFPWEDFEELMPFFEQFRKKEQQPAPEEEQKQNYSYGSGTGFVWDDLGHIVTNNHVIDNATKITVTYSDGITRNATLVGADPDSDLAVIQVEDFRPEIKPLKIGDSSTIKVGELVAAIGNPFGNTGTMTTGIISALGRSFALERDISSQGGTYTIPDMIQTDAAINPGNSGGVLINIHGEVIGIVNSFASSTYSNAGIGYAIPSNLASRVVPQLISTGEYRHAWIGISGIALTQEINQLLELDKDQRGALVQSIQPNSPAEKAGIRGGTEKGDIEGRSIMINGDIVTKINERDVKGMDDIIAYLASNTSIGDTISLQILRDGKEITQELTLAARPTSKERNQQANKPDSEETQTDIGSAWLGTFVRDITEKDISALDLPAGTTGALVDQVTKDSPADDAKMQENDIIQKVDSTEVKDVRDLKEILTNYTPGERITLTVLRNGKTEEIRLTLGTTKIR
jgi:S1-C subfamily serine protease